MDKKILTSADKEQLLEKIQKELPPGWIVRFSKKHENRVYYFNLTNGRRTWGNPIHSGIFQSKYTLMELSIVYFLIL